MATLLTAGTVVLVAAPSAWAGARFTVGPSVPNTVVVGATGVNTTIEIENTSFNGPGETNYDTDNFQINSITLVPSCGSQMFSADCPVGSEDPGAIVPAPLTGSGRAGTACAGRTFTIALSDAVQGKYTFTPNVTVVLGPTVGAVPAKTCAIDFASTIARMPAIDSDTDAGIQTDQKAFANGEAVTIGSPIFGQTAGGIGTAQTTVNRATPTLTTIASSPTTPSSALTDNATISGLVNAVQTGAGAGTVEFRLYGPNDATCATVVFTSPSRPIAYSGGGSVGSANSTPFTPTAPGVYRWRAFYSGDTSNAPINGPCNAANENATVPPPPPPPGSPPPPPPPGSPPPPPPPAPCTPLPGPVPPGGPPLCEKPSEVCTPPPGPAPAGGELCARGTAAIKGTTGCAGVPFRVVVRGRQIERVTFTLDGRTIRTLSRPNRGSLYVLAVNPRTLRVGVHRILARTTFRTQSGTRPRTLRVTFSRCARRASAPAFTG